MSEGVDVCSVGVTPTRHGPTQILRVPYPLAGGGAPWKIAYAAILQQPKLDVGHPAVLLLTVKSVKRAVAAGVPDQHWSPWLDQVDHLYADPAVRQRVPGVPFAVQVGRWMYKQRLFEAHSPDRTLAGDRWAKAVGGCLPAISGTNFDFEDAGHAALNWLRTTLLGEQGRKADESDLA